MNGTLRAWTLLDDGWFVNDALSFWCLAQFPAWALWQPDFGDVYQGFVGSRLTQPTVDKICGMLRYLETPSAA